jgi:hypothetical protein
MESKLSNVMFQYRELLADSLQALTPIGDLQYKVFNFMTKAALGPMVKDHQT